MRAPRFGRILPATKLPPPKGGGIFFVSCDLDNRHAGLPGMARAISRSSNAVSAGPCACSRLQKAGLGFIECVDR